MLVNKEMVTLQGNKHGKPRKSHKNHIGHDPVDRQQK